MNYLRGAVNAISAPYQYYKELPPINPSTLTGAIDVIVIRRPANDGSTELVCSPFHVRFGKWQVLRPSEKKVNVFVNGNPIPFNMKIGEAGEAFFVFETEDDVPEDLITSPIIQPTIIDATTDKSGKNDPIDSDRFGAKQDDEQGHPATGPSKYGNENARVEPDFLDLDGRKQASGANEDLPATPKQTYHVPQPLRKSGSKATINQQSTLTPPEQLRDRSHTPEMDEQDQLADEALKALRGRAHIPEVEYHHDVTLDMEGYKSVYHDRGRSDSTVKPSSSSRHNSSRDFRYETSSSQLAAKPSQNLPQSPSPPILLNAQLHPFRATSEPPPDLESENSDFTPFPVSAQKLNPSKSGSDMQPPLQEYSWEWGAFPQPSPIKASFSKGGRPEPPHKAIWGLEAAGRKKRVSFSERKGRPWKMTLPDDNKDEDRTAPDTERLGGNISHHGRSRSIPPDFLTQNIGKRSKREYKEYEDLDEETYEEEHRGRDRLPWKEGRGPVEKLGIEEVGDAKFGYGGSLCSSKEDPSTFVLNIEGKKYAFQISLVAEESIRSKRRDELETGELFKRYQVAWNRFLEDESIVTDPRLVIRWDVNQYISRNDGSPLMDALVQWRLATLEKQASGEVLRPVSPPPPEGQREDEEAMTWEPPVDLNAHNRSKYERPSDAKTQEAGTGDKAQAPNQSVKKPTSSSWVQWWSRSRRTESQSVLVTKKDSSTSSLSLTGKTLAEKRSVTSDAVKTNSVPTTPVQHPVGISPKAAVNTQEITPTRPPTEKARPKKYAKTLRLTSEQLTALNLKSGANAITFSLSATGAIAATARIFVWDYTDLVVISDIDGTITKSDGLGHVFAMIGRDWTHVGVAKLYTDIVRNGYKIMYLTSRAIGQADATRDYLKGIKQNNYQLPEGPVIMSPDRLMASLHREVIMRKPEVFKMACLRDIQRLFGESARNPFYAGFGNRITDALSYRSVNVPSARIFTIDSSGEVKMELLELAGYKSSYIHMTDLVDQMFPPINRKWTPEYTDFNYWKTPVQEYPLPDLSPPSPALSARSDTSNQSALARLRNFSLGGNSTTISRQSYIKQGGNGEQDADGYRSSHLRQMSSFERLSSTLGFIGDSYRRSASPDSSAYMDSDDEDDSAIGPDGQKRVRRRSMTSMPGTLDEMHFGLDDDEDDGVQFGEPNGGHEGEDEIYEDEVDEDPEEQAEEAFDDDLLATGEMAKVPFL